MRFFLASTFLLSIVISQAQTTSYLDDLPALKSIIQKTSSYKAQIKDRKAELYDSIYNRLARDTVNNISGYKYFHNLSQLFFPLRDNHLAFYQIPDYNNFRDKTRIDSFVKTPEFSAYPKYEINIDSLKSALATKPAESIEGIYHYDKFYDVGLFKCSDKEYVGVVVNTEVNLWQKGQIAFHLYEYQPGLYKAIYGHPLRKNFILQSNEKYINQSLVNSYFYGSYTQKTYSKNLGQTDYVNLPQAAPAFELKHIDSKIQYLLIRTFQANNATMDKSEKFYESIKDSLSAPNLILDLRNNEGGAEKSTTKYFKLIKENTNTGHVYILLNNGTLSQAEIFALELKKLKNVVTIGQTTKGMLAYGSNYGKRERLPSGKFEVYITDMKGSAALLQYEDQGIHPDILLNGNADWIDQAIDIIRKK